MNEKTPFHMEPPEQSLTTKIARSKTIASKAFDPGEYEFKDTFDVKESETVETVRTVEGLVKLAEAGKCEVDAIVIHQKDDKRQMLKMKSKDFVEAFRKGPAKDIKLKESDSFITDAGYSGGLVGQDFVPLLGGPFNKQLYMTDYLKMHSTAFHAYHHDPIARRCVNLIRDFTLGRGWKVTSKNPLAQALWAAFEEANDLYDLMNYIAIEIELYGETMIWNLPNGQAKITYNLSQGQTPPKALIPRVRVIDPSVIWEIVTYPEDISRVLYYQWVAPTQYQMYTGRADGGNVPGSKFIYQQIPGEQVDHFKINCVSNEKRGRSGLFPVLGYLKRLRDSVNYAIIAMQKASAWSMDTEIDGSQEDIDAYMSDQQSLGTIAPAGSEFVHSTKVKRTYASNAAASTGGASQAFEWCLSMIASGIGIPISYLNTHLSGGSTRASALVATEPVTKMFEKRQLVYEQILQKMATRLFEQFGLRDAEIEVTFPELVVQDRSAKLKDLALAESQGWITKKRAAEIAAQELQITEFNYDNENEKMKAQAAMTPGQSAPLTAPGAVDNKQPEASRSDIANGMKHQLNKNKGF